MEQVVGIRPIARSILRTWSVRAAIPSVTGCRCCRISQIPSWEQSFGVDAIGFSSIRMLGFSSIEMLGFLDPGSDA